MTPKQTLLAHLQGDHRALAKTKLDRKTMKELQSLHALQHHRFTPRNHFHWNGTDEDKNLGASQRPAGWKTGEDVVVMTPPKVLVGSISL